MDRILDALSRATDRLSELVPELVAATLVLVLFFVLGRLVSSALMRMFRAGPRGNRYSRLVGRLVSAGFGVLGLVLGLQILGLTAVATSLLATGGLLAVVLGFAFREIGENLLAGLFLGMSRSFDVGDLIESSGHVGKVKEIDLRQVHIRSSDGRDIFIPSAQIFRNVLINFTRDGLRRGSFVVGIDYADDVPRARELLVDAARSAEHVMTEPGSTSRISAFTANYCELEVFFWIDTDRGPGLAELRSTVMASCLESLRRNGFTLSSDVSTAVAVSHVDRKGG